MAGDETYRRQVTRMIESGWRVEEDTPERVTLVRREFGSPGIHLALAVFTIWWAMGVPNLLYAAYKYLTDSQRTVIWKRPPEESERTPEPSGAV